DSDAFTGVGRALSISAGRLSYFLDAMGPCLVLDTACSSSLVAVHQACESLRSGESDCAIVGGGNALLDPEVAISFSHGGFLARDGECKTFDQRADGYVRSEGCGVVVIKRLTDAERDGDRILCVVRATAVNHDGRSQGLTAPNGLAQQAVIREA